MCGRLKPSTLVSSTLAAVLAGIIASAGLVGCGGVNVCSSLACADLIVTSLDNNKTFNLTVGQRVIESLPDSSKAATASSSDPTVVKQTDGPGWNGSELHAAFKAVAGGSARLRLAYTVCEMSAGTPCFVEITVNVIDLPKTQVQLFASDFGTTTKLHVGEAALITLQATDEHYWNMAITPSGVVEWSAPPTLFHYQLLKGVLRASSPGEATLTGVVNSCRSTSTVCQFVFFFSVKR